MGIIQYSREINPTILPVLLVVGVVLIEIHLKAPASQMDVMEVQGVVVDHLMMVLDILVMVVATLLVKVLMEEEVGTQVEVAEVLVGPG
jgi:hypothetical protein